MKREHMVKILLFSHWGGSWLNRRATASPETKQTAFAFRVISSQLTSHFSRAPAGSGAALLSWKTSPLGLSPSNHTFPFTHVCSLNLFFIFSHCVGGLRRSVCSFFLTTSLLGPNDPFETCRNKCSLLTYFHIDVWVPLFPPHRLCLGSSGLPHPNTHAFRSLFNERRVFMCVPYARTPAPPPHSYIFAPWHVELLAGSRYFLQLVTEVLPSHVVKGQYGAFHCIRLCCCTLSW